MPHTTGLWKHIYKPIQYTLLIYDSGKKFTNKKHTDHLINALKKHYKLAKDWTGSLYCGIDLKFYYDNRTLDISMLGYIKKLLKNYNYIMKNKPQHTPYQPAPRKYGEASQDPIEDDTTARVDASGIIHIQQVVCIILYYACALYHTIIMSLRTISSK